MKVPGSPLALRRCDTGLTFRSGSAGALVSTASACLPCPEGEASACLLREPRVPVVLQPVLFLICQVPDGHTPGRARGVWEDRGIFSCSVFCPVARAVGAAAVPRRLCPFLLSAKALMCYRAFVPIGGCSPLSEGTWVCCVLRGRATDTTQWAVWLSNSVLGVLCAETPVNK